MGAHHEGAGVALAPVGDDEADRGAAFREAGLLEVGELE